MKSFIFIIIFSPLVSLAFPENIRHNYNNCTSCHVSPSGGGLLTEYGRSLSKELMSTWGAANEELVGHGFLPKSSVENFLLGGDLRLIQTYVNNTSLEKGQFFTMQSMLEGAYHSEKWTVLATAGTQGGPDGTLDKNKFLSQRHFVAYRPTEETSLRAGRFMPVYGINLPNHTAVTRRSLGFDQNSETYNAELAYIGESWDAFLTYVGGRPDKTELKREKGASSSLSHTFSTSYKVGASFYTGENEDQRRELAGLFGIIGFNEKLYLLSEIDSQNLRPKSSNSSSGYVTYQQLGYELYKGVNPFLVYQISHLDTSRSTSKFEAQGIGIQWLPRPHFEITGQWDKQFRSTETSDFAWLIFHYYL